NLFHVYRRLYRIWRGEEVYAGETSVCLNNQLETAQGKNGLLTKSISEDNSTSIIETKDYSAKSVINGQEKKKKSRSKSHREQSSDTKHLNESDGDYPRANVQCDTSRRDALRSSDQVPVNKIISFDTKLEKLQKATEQIRRIN
ncbi:hypothetical protein C1646_813896, partial [Rhizophagus diaphanus]